MIKLQKGISQTIKVSLNPSNVALGVNINFVIDSPSRDSLTLSKALAELGSGFYSFDVDAVDIAGLVDNTYYYTITQSGTTLKRGYINLIE